MDAYKNFSTLIGCEHFDLSHAVQQVDCEGEQLKLSAKSWNQFGIQQSCQRTTKQSGRQVMKK